MGIGISLRPWGISASVLALGVTEFNASGSDAQSTGTTDGANYVNLDSPADFNTNEYAGIYGAGPAGPSAPATPTLTVVGTPGTTSLAVRVIASDGNGGLSAVSAEASIANAPDDPGIDIDNYVDVEVPTATGTYSYHFYANYDGAGWEYVGGAAGTYPHHLYNRIEEWTTQPEALPEPADVTTFAGSAQLLRTRVTSVSNGGLRLGLEKTITVPTSTPVLVTHDDTIPLQNAYAEARSKGLPLFIPPGNYRIILKDLSDSVWDIDSSTRYRIFPVDADNISVYSQGGNLRVIALYMETKFDTSWPTRQQYIWHGGVTTENFQLHGLNTYCEREKSQGMVARDHANTWNALYYMSGAWTRSGYSGGNMYMWPHCGNEGGVIDDTGGGLGTAKESNNTYRDFEVVGYGGGRHDNAFYFQGGIRAEKVTINCRGPAGTFLSKGVKDKSHTVYTGVNERPNQTYTDFIIRDQQYYPKARNSTLPQDLNKAPIGNHSWSMRGGGATGGSLNLSNVKTINCFIANMGYTSAAYEDLDFTDVTFEATPVAIYAAERVSWKGGSIHNTDFGNSSFSLIGVRKAEIDSTIDCVLQMFYDGTRGLENEHVTITGFVRNIDCRSGKNVTLNSVPAAAFLLNRWGFFDGTGAGTIENFVVNGLNYTTNGIWGIAYVNGDCDITFQDVRFRSTDTAANPVRPLIEKVGAGGYIALKGLTAHHAHTGTTSPQDDFVLISTDNTSTVVRAMSCNVERNSASPVIVFGGAAVPTDQLKNACFHGMVAI